MDFITLLEKAIGKKVTVEYPNEDITGKLVDIDTWDFMMILECNDGSTLLIPYNNKHIRFIKILPEGS